MGTSISKRDAPSASVLIPPWADQDPPVPPQNPPPTPPDDDQNAPGAPAPNPPLAEPRRYNGFRRRLSRYAATGDRDDGRKALGHWVRTSMGGASAGTQRLSRAIRLGGGALAAVSSAGSGQTAAAGSLDVRGLAGLPVDVAIGRIVDAFCPPGIADEDALRSAMGEALALVLAGADTFDPAAIDQNAVRVAILSFATELVFVSVTSDAKNALTGVSPSVAIDRENGLRSLIREVADDVGTPLLAAAGSLLAPAAVTNLVSRLVLAVQTEMETWL